MSEKIDFDEVDEWDDGYCPNCGYEGDHLESACIDDLCYGGPVPCELHGDYSTLPCPLCGRAAQ